MCDAGWELFCLERDIRPDGQMPSISSSKFDFYDPIFFDTSHSKYVPRAALDILLPTVADKVRCSIHTR
jgi:tubulin alpha